MERRSSRLRTVAVGAFVVVAPGLLASCGSPFGPCFLDQVRVSLPASIERDGGTETATLTGQVAPSNLSVPEFETVRAVLTRDTSSETAGVVWTVPAFDANPGWVAVAIQAPVAAGDVLPVDQTFDGAGWGVFALGSGARIAASVRAGDYVATAVTGTVEVLAVAPLRLRLDLTARDAGGATIRVRGDASFSFERTPTACT